VKEKAVLYLGVDPKYFQTEKPLIHLPLIEVVARTKDSIEIKEVFSEIDLYTHIIFSSRNAVKVFFDYLRQARHHVSELKHKYIIAIGQMSAHALKEEGATPTYIAADETQSGVIRVLSSLDLSDAYVLLPKSSSARPILSHFLVEHEIKHRACIFYDVYAVKPFITPDLDEIDEIVFTDPSAVEAFFNLYPEISPEIRLHPLGESSRIALRKALAQEHHVSIL
jgi:uroporphyrinogen-III synthase